MAMNKLYIVCVPISQDDYPQKIFESINATGAKLTASDLIRNFMLMPILSDKQEEYYAKYWKRLQELPTSDSKKLEAFFRLYLAAKNRTLPNKTAVYNIFVDWFNKNKDIFVLLSSKKCVIIKKDILHMPNRRRSYVTIKKQVGGLLCLDIPNGIIYKRQRAHRTQKKQKYLQNMPVKWLLP